MRTILFIIQKEVLQVFRNKAMLPMIFVVPIIQLVVLVNVATFEIKNIRLFVVDKDMTPTSRQLISKLQGSPFFKIVNSSFSEDDGIEEVKKGTADEMIEIPFGFERNLFKEGNATLQLNINAINSMVAGLSYGYTSSVITDFNSQLLTNNPKKLTTYDLRLKTINITYSHWFNPELNYKNFMVPGILVLLITIIALLFSGMNIVREKEMGTIEQINVTPIKKYQFIIGKLFPFWVLGLMELTLGLIIGKLVFNIPIVGSLWLVFLGGAVYLPVILAIGLFVSTLANTQQQAMFVTFFLMMIFILMSGLFTAIENMPQWAQIIDKLNPLAYYIRINRLVLLKGSNLYDIAPEILSLLVMGIIMFTLAVRRYRKTT